MRETFEEKKMKQIFRRFGQDARNKKEYLNVVVVVVVVAVSPWYPLCLNPFTYQIVALKENDSEQCLLTQSHTMGELSEFKIFAFLHYHFSM